MLEDFRANVLKIYETARKKKLFQTYLHLLIFRVQMLYYSNFWQRWNFCASKPYFQLSTMQSKLRR